jgi:hypothetical protein
MARTPNPATDFSLDVEGIGKFMFAKRTMRDECECQVEFARIIQGVEPTQWLNIVGGALADLRTLTVVQPQGFDLETLDPLDAESYNRLVKVHNALRDKERSFRRGNGAPSEGSGAESVQHNRVPVPAEIQPAGN